MKRTLIRASLIFALSFLCGTSAFARPKISEAAAGVSTLAAGGGQTGGGHSGTLSWTLSIDDTTTECSVAGANCSQNVYRASGTCTQTSPVFTLLSNQSAAAVSYTDNTITPGTWCYAVTFEIQATESVKATAQVSLQAAPVTGLAVVAK